MMLFRTPRPPLLVALSVFLVVATLYIITAALGKPASTIPPAAARLKDNRCAAFPRSNNVVLTVKTGATEAYDKLPTQLLSHLQCAENLLLFSDLEQNIGSYHIHDVLDRMSPSVVAANSDFDIYRAQKFYQAEGRDISSLSRMKDLREQWNTAGHNAAWALDKYKFLHMVERAWEMYPNKDWYIFSETDAYIVWANLKTWLGNLNPRKPLYLGMAVPMNEEGPGFDFGHGGAGFVLSRAAMKEFCVKHKGLASRWDKRVPDLWFGDYVLAKALKEDLKLNVTNVWPHLNGYKVSTMPVGKDIWCKKVITLHHLRPDEVQYMWALEQSRHQTSTAPPPLTFADLFHARNIKSFPKTRNDWDNLSQDRDYALSLPSKLEGGGGDPNASPDLCAKACAQVPECKQWSHLKFSITAANKAAAASKDAKRADAKADAKADPKAESKDVSKEDVSKKKADAKPDPKTTDSKADTKAEPSEKKDSKGGVCYLSSVFRIGEDSLPYSFEDKDGAINNHSRVSGWMNGRIGDWLAKAQCTDVK